MWPGVKLVKLRYVDVDTPALTIGLGNFDHSQYYKINDPFDPNPALASSGMPGFTEYAAMYHKYRVLASKLSMEAVVSGVDIPVIVGFHMDSGTVTTATYSDVMQLLTANKDSVYKMITPYQKAKLSIFRKHGNLYGNTLQYKADDNFDANTGGSPGNLLRGYVFATTADGTPAAAAIPIYVRITLTMYIRFSDPKQIFGV